MAERNQSKWHVPYRPNTDSNDAMNWDDEGQSKNSSADLEAANLGKLLQTLQTVDVQQAMKEFQNLTENQARKDQTGDPMHVTMTGTGTPINSNDTSSDTEVQPMFQKLSEYIDRSRNDRDFASARAELNKLHQFVVLLISKKNLLTNQLSQKEAVNLELATKYRETMEKLATTDNSSSSDIRKRCRQLREEADNYKERLGFMSSQLKETSEQNKILVDQKNKLMTDFNAEREAKERALSRLSSEYGQQLYKDNTTIVDLSDPKRPEKIAEKFSELYDKEWTETLEKIGDEYPEYKEEKLIKFLQTILRECYCFCSENGESQLSQIKMALLCPDGENEASEEDCSSSSGSSRVTKAMKSLLPEVLQKKFSSTNDKEKAAQEIDNLCKEIRKTMASKSIPALYEKFLCKITDKFEGSRKHQKMKELLKQYAEKCLDICWTMCLQSPPMVFESDTSEGTSMDTSVYRSYTRNGEIVEFIVWPAMLQYEGGPVVMKGIAQPYKSTSKSSGRTGDDLSSLSSLGSSGTTSLSQQSRSASGMTPHGSSVDRDTFASAVKQQPGSRTITVKTTNHPLQGYYDYRSGKYHYY